MTLDEAKFMVTHPESVRRSDIDSALTESREAEAAHIVQIVADQLCNTGALGFEDWENISLLCEEVKAV